LRDPRRVWPWAAQHKVEQKHKKQARATHYNQGAEHMAQGAATEPRAYNSRNTQQSIYRIHVLIKTEGARVHSRAGRREVPPPGSPAPPGLQRPAGPSPFATRKTACNPRARHGR